MVLCYSRFPSKQRTLNGAVLVLLPPMRAGAGADKDATRRPKATIRCCVQLRWAALFQLLAQLPTDLQSHANVAA